MRYIISPTNDSRSSWIRTNTISAIYHRSSLPIELLSDETGLLLEAKKPLERTPHFFEPGVGECVNALGQLVDLKGFEPLNPKVFELKSNAFSNFATDPYECLSLQTVTEIFTRRFSQRRSLLQHSGGFLFLCEVAPLFRGSRFPP